MRRAIPFRGLLRHPVANSESLESAALLVGALVFVLTGIVAAIVFWGRDVPIAGPGSVGQFVAAVCGLTALVVFLGARIVLDRSTEPSDPAPARGLGYPQVRMHWYDLAAIAIAHGVVALLGWLSLIGLFDRSFVGATVFTIPAIVLSAAAAAVTAYAVFLFAINLTPLLLSVLLALFLVVGVFTSMLSASDPMWWKKHLSNLGVTNDISSLAFNLTLIIAGVIVTIVAHYATAGIVADTPGERRGRRIVHGALVLLGILLAGVGVFPLDVSMALHNLSASGMVAVFVTLVIGLRAWVPEIPRVFLILGYVYIALIAVLAVFFITGYYNLTAVELVAFLLIFSWLIVLIRNTTAMTGEDEAPGAGGNGVPAGRIAGIPERTVR